jgi:urease accessory protein
MPRATDILTAPERGEGPLADTLVLSSVQRQTQKGFLFGLKGTCVELDFSEPVMLRTDDVLVLDDGRLIEVVAEPEPLIEVRAADASALARLAWHLGDRHVPVQILERRMRVRREPVAEAFLESLGVKMTLIEAPFEPENIAGPGGDHHHHHGHDHAHDHDHDHAHGHDHTHHHKHG